MFIGWAWASPDHADGERVADDLRRAAPPDDGGGPADSLAGLAVAGRLRSSRRGCAPTGRTRRSTGSTMRRSRSSCAAAPSRPGAAPASISTTWRARSAACPPMRRRSPAGRRDSGSTSTGTGQMPADDAARTAFVRGFAADMAPHARAAQYVNFLGREGRWRSIRWPQPGRLRPRHVRSTRRAQAPLRPRQSVPPQPQHPDRLIRVRRQGRISTSSPSRTAWSRPTRWPSKRADGPQTRAPRERRRRGRGGPSRRRRRRWPRGRGRPVPGRRRRPCGGGRGSGRSGAQTASRNGSRRGLVEDGDRHDRRGRGRPPRVGRARRRPPRRPGSRRAPPACRCRPRRPRRGPPRARPDRHRPACSRRSRRPSAAPRAGHGHRRDRRSRPR